MLLTATQAELAQLAGSSRESASRFLAVLERAGVISQGRGRLTVHDPAALAAAMSTDRRVRDGIETSYGGVAVRGARGARDHARGPAPRHRAAQGRRRTPARPASRRPAREVREETGITVDVGEPLGDVDYSYRRDGRRIRKTVHFYLCDFVSGSTDDHDHEVDEARWIPLEEALTALSYPGERRLIARALSKLRDRRRPALGSPPVQVLNFYSTVFADQMKRGRKTATIRLGDKRHKYRKNQVVLVTVGYQYSPREKLFHAVIDNVDVKRVKDLSPRDIEHDNPEFRRTEELVHFLEQIYGREVSLEDTVTVVRFSQIVENPPDLQDRLRGVGGAQN